ncbi:glycosyltransferase [Streptomyces sp. NPDC015171]|uniref:glycosyltransferase n=1 Tax=Streptomyces sp. NPDC015171 TaxID=3364945 RepID=UPI0036FCF6EB
MTFAFECGAFDPRLMRSGTAALVWNSAAKLAEHGHTVSIVTPAHGHGRYLREQYGATATDFADEFRMPLVLDPEIWPGFPSRVDVPLRTTALHTRHQGVDLHFLSNAHLDLFPEAFVPDAGAEGRDLSFFKELVFQVAGVRFIRQVLGTADLVQAYEPYQHYLLPLALRGAPGIPVVSTLATNLPVDRQVSRPQVAELLSLLGVEADLDALSDPPEDHGAPHEVRRRYPPSTPLGPAAQPGGVACHSLVLEHAAAVDFLTEGQAEHCATFADTPFEERFGRLTVSRVTRRNADKMFVGGCAVSDGWLRREAAEGHRQDFLTGLGLDPSLPTFYHSARYAPHHKGQSELFRAVGRVLDEGLEANFLIRCALPGSMTRQELPSYVRDVVERHTDRLRADWEMVDEATLFAHASAADFCVFPSKFEMDTFLIAQGEAMACGAVPIATLQSGTRHFGHAFDWRGQPGATGFAVARSFRPDDELLRDRLAERMREAARLFRHEPGTYAELSDRARRTARQLTWEAATRLREDRFRHILTGAVEPTGPETLIRRGWYDGLGDETWAAHRELIALSAAARGGADACVRACAGRPDLAEAAFDTAYRAARFRVCEALLDLPGSPPGHTEQAHSVRHRLRVRERGDRADIVYRFPHAERIELFGPEAGSPADGFGQPLSRSGDEFRGNVPGPLGDHPVVLLITLPRGRFVWDEVRPVPEH